MGFRWAAAGIKLVVVILVHHWGKIRHYHIWLIIRNCSYSYWTNWIMVQHVQRGGDACLPLLLSICWIQMRIVYSRPKWWISILAWKNWIVWIHIFPFWAHTSCRTTPYLNPSFLPTVYWTIYSWLFPGVKLKFGYTSDPQSLEVW